MFDLAYPVSLLTYGRMFLYTLETLTAQLMSSEGV